MLYVYLFAAIAGVILMGASLVGGGGDDGAGGHDADHGGDGHDGHGAAIGAIGALLSLRVWTYVLTFGGLTGLVLRLLARVPEPLAALSALACGVVAAAAARGILRRATAGGAAGALKTEALVGRSAEVLVPFDKGTTGKVRVQINDRTLDLLATTDDATLGPRDEVLIVEVRDGATAHVTRTPTADPAPVAGPPRGR